jgi:hypothetical protein
VHAFSRLVYRKTVLYPLAGIGHQRQLFVAPLVALLVERMQQRCFADWLVLPFRLFSCYNIDIALTTCALHHNSINGMSSRLLLVGGALVAQSLSPSPPLQPGSSPETAKQKKSTARYARFELYRRGRPCRL